MDNAIAGFCSVTGTDAETARKYLEISEGNIDQAISLYFDNANIFSDHAASAQDNDSPSSIEFDEDENSMEMEEMGRSNRIYENQEIYIPKGSDIQKYSVSIFDNAESDSSGYCAHFM
ncbi:uncharacterized protein [Blastocystis hominis]|uniref:UBA domain-containing protein n=1 Tax=Blastocystis hominis TaxID=12968 RepID=D8LYL9_BLAHO|nr:uncharacterized protein [Blastocystis hominis]CBK20674.2 unnamed protein product [Blastocystis hominis]|eukprot:XP_012894722.1 uncharacterized protein [Blastocystis hominis]